MTKLQHRWHWNIKRAGEWHSLRNLKHQPFQNINHTETSTMPKHQLRWNSDHTKSLVKPKHQLRQNIDIAELDWPEGSAKIYSYFRLLLGDKYGHQIRPVCFHKNILYLTECVTLRCVQMATHSLRHKEVICS